MKTINTFLLITTMLILFGLLHKFSYLRFRYFRKSKATGGIDIHYTMLETHTKRGWKPGLQYTLVDIDELYVRSEKKPIRITNGTFRILHYGADQNQFNNNSDNKVIHTECMYTNCEFTSDMRQMTQSDAVIFHLSENGSISNLQPPERKRGQVWVLSNTIPHLSSDLDIPAIDAKWRNTINWTMSYRFDSDILWSQGTFRTRRIDEFPNKDYYVASSYRKQKAMAIIKNCDTYASGGLRKHMTKLKTFLRVDVYGECKGMMSLPSNLTELVLSYYFLIVFEEYNCPHLVSKTLFDLYDLDIFLVIHGSADYNEFIPNDVFVNFADFKTIQQKGWVLQHFLQYLEQGVEYLRRKDLYVTTEAVRWQCDLCQKLNNQNDNQNVYESLVPVLERNICVKRTFR